MDNQAAESLAFLEDAKSAVIELEEAKTLRQKLSQTEIRLKKQLSAEEKAVVDEIAATTKKRKEEVSTSFDKEITSAQENLKKLKSQKEQAKKKGRRERIQTETAELREESRSLKEELNTLLKKNHVPRMCRSRWFYVFFMPEGVWDYVLSGALVVFFFFILPYFSFTLLPYDEPIFLSFLHFVFFVFFGGIYVLISEGVKYKYVDVLRKAVILRRSIAENKKKMDIIVSSINKDPNEEHYDLDDFNYSIAKAEAQIEEISGKKQEALQTFEVATKHVIEDEIQEGSREKIDGLKYDIESNHRELEAAKERVSALNIEVTDKYAGRIGRENMQVDTLEQIAKQIRSGSAVSITDAISLYRSSRS